MGAGEEDLVKNADCAAENPVNHATGTTDNPIYDKEDSLENPANDQAVDLIIRVNDQPISAESPVINQAVAAENPAIDKADNAENPFSDQPNVAENALIDQAGGTEISVSDQANVPEIPLNNPAGGPDLVNDQVNVAENPANDPAGGTENPVSGLAAAPENAMKEKIGDEGNPENNQDDEVVNLVKQDVTENLLEVIGTPSNSQEDVFETPVSSRADLLPAEAKEILESLAGKWEDVLDASALQVIPLKGAMTNQVFEIKWPTTTGETSRKVLVRIYGKGVDIFFDRSNEIRTFEHMSKNGQGPLLLGRFTNGRVEEFIHARTLSAYDLRDPSISGLIASKMKEFHDLDMPGDKKVNLWDTLRIWLGEAKRLSSPKEVEAFYLDTIDKEISTLEKELSGADQRIGFCHNDLQYGNIMLDEETNSVTIIDYEYASYNPIAYDIANHFCEMGANYHSETPHILDYSNYPDLEERKRFVEAYLNSSGKQPSESELEHLLQAVEKYTLANHLFWGLWGIISGQVNTIDFDYKEYAKQRFQEYWARKPYLLSSDSPSPFNVPEGTGELASALPHKGTKNSGIFRKMKRVFGLGVFRSKN